jgi:hypothetical protein
LARSRAATATAQGNVAPISSVAGSSTQALTSSSTTLDTPDHAMPTRNAFGERGNRAIVITVVSPISA